MKKYKTIINEVSKLSNTKKALIEYDGPSITSWLQLNDEERRATRDKKLEIEEANKVIQKYNSSIDLKRVILEHNMRCALYEDIKEPLIEVLNKYKNKPLGPKTQDNLKNDFKHLTGCNMYIDTRYSCASVIVYLLNDEGYRIGHDYEVEVYFKKDNECISLLTDSNRIQVLTIENAYCNYNASCYVDNINKYIKDYLKAYKKAAQAQETYNEAIKVCNSFNALKNSHSSDLRKCYCNRFNDNYLL